MKARGELSGAGSHDLAASESPSGRPRTDTRT
jgi:hypothetical protein